MSLTESIFSKKERKIIYAEYQKTHSDQLDSNTKFLCACGEEHSWSEIGRKH